MERVAIIGGGAAGAALAFYLAKAGRKVVVFDRMNRPALVVGESMIPAVIPFLRDFGIEDEVRGYATYKPGATFVFNSEEKLSVTFAEVRKAKVEYAYNIPRGDLDASVLASAQRAGAHVVKASAQVERVEGIEAVRLAGESRACAETLLGGSPELLVDASGRARMLSTLLRIGRDEGPRKDTVLFAHCQGVSLVEPGNIHVDVLQRGWSWRIPLPGRVSVGFVMGSQHTRSFGSSLEEQFDAILQHEPQCKQWGENPRRITQVVKYNNYQLISHRGVGEGWAMVGDSLGFVDPVFSSGTLLAYHSAKQLARAIVAGGGRAQLDRYEKGVVKHLRSWQKTIDHFYSGRLLTLFRVGDKLRDTRLGGLMDLHFRKHIPRAVTGEGSAGFYSPALVDFMCRHAIVDFDPEDLRIH